MAAGQSKCAPIWERPISARSRSLCRENERRRLSADFIPVRQPSPALLEQARAGDAAAFCELIREHEARVLRQALALCGDATLAEDLAQDTFVAAWKSI